jgi:hypothetical protein
VTRNPGSNGPPDDRDATWVTARCATVRSVTDIFYAERTERCTLDVAERDVAVAARIPAGEELADGQGELGRVQHPVAVLV